MSYEVNGFFTKGDHCILPAYVLSISSADSCAYGIWRNSEL